MAVSLSGMSLHTNNDNETWSGTDDPDDYNNAIQGSNSESWQVSKNSTETGTLVKSSTLNTTRGIFTFWMSSNLAPYYTDIDFIMESSNNNQKLFQVANSTNKAIGGNFVASAIDYVNKGTETGTFAPASFSELRLVVDNSSSGNIRSVINNWIDAMYYGVGHTVSGTTTTDKAFAEAAAVDELVANKYGVMWKYNDIIYSQGDINLAGTLTSEGETLVFVDTLNGYDTYNLDITGTVDFTNTSIIAGGAIDFNFDSSTATSFSMTGGSVTGALATTTKSGQTHSGVVFTDCGTFTVANTPYVSTFNSCGQITLSTGGELDSCKIDKSTAAISVTTDDLSDVDGCIFVSDGSNHAVELTSIGAGSMVWDASLSVYESGGSGGSPVTPTSTGNEAIYVNVGSGTLTINVADTGTTPSIRSAGATVNVVSGQKSLTFTDLPDGVEVRIRQGSHSIFHVASASGGSEAYTYTYTSDTIVTISVGGSGYIREELTYILKNSDASLSFPLEPNPSYIA